MNWILCIFMLFLGSCDQKSQETRYKEIVIQPDQMGALHASGAMSHELTWTTPQGWSESAGEGMRLATFHLRSNPEAIDCSIVSLGGMAGGLEDNLRRWMGQLAIPISDDQVNNLITSAQTVKTKDGLEVKIFDFTNLQAQGSLSDRSMLAAVIVLDKTTVFVKMTGAIQAIKYNKDDYLKLLGSITSS